MARAKEWTDEEILKRLQEYLAEIDAEGTPRSSITIQNFSQYLGGKGIKISDNVLRHRPAVAEKFARAKRGLPDPGKREGDVPPLEETYLELLDLFEEYFEKGAFHYILNRSQTGKFIQLQEYLKPEVAEQTIITPKTKPFESEAAKRAKRFFERKGKKNE